MSLAAVVFLIPSLLAQDEPLRHPWSGFSSGSWIQLTQTVRDRVTHQERVTRENLAQDLPVLAAPESGLVLTGRRRETLRIKNRTLDCEVLQYAGADDEPSRWVSLTIWKARGISLPPRDVWSAPTFGVPADVVKLLRCDLKRDQVRSVALDVVDLDAKITVNGSALESTVEDVFTITAVTDRDTGIRGRRRWVCDAIPGRIARRDETCIAGSGGGYYTMEITDFKARR